MSSARRERKLFPLASVLRYARLPSGPDHGRRRRRVIPTPPDGRFPPGPMRAPSGGPADPPAAAPALPGTAGQEGRLLPPGRLGTKNSPHQVRRMEPDLRRSLRVPCRHGVFLSVQDARESALNKVLHTSELLHSTRSAPRVAVLGTRAPFRPSHRIALYRYVSLRISRCRFEYAQLASNHGH